MGVAFLRGITIPLHPRSSVWESDSGIFPPGIFRAARLVHPPSTPCTLSSTSLQPTVFVRISVARPLCCVRSTPSLARSITKGRGDRTPETDENRRTTVGVDLFNHKLRNGTECKIYDVAGQVWSSRHDALMFSRARSRT